MILQLKKTGRLELTMLLAVMSAFCFTLSLTRYWLSHSTVYLFLNWNLFLAFIPWVASSAIMVNKNEKINKLLMLPLIFSWLAFFPNSPYILTDLFHFRSRSGVPLWFDLVLILSFAWTGLTFGLASLFDIEKLLSPFLNKWILKVLLMVLLFAGSFGVYVGRYLRWNSWDIISEPVPLLYDIGDRFKDPLDHPQTWGMTILLGILLNLIFWTFKIFTSARAEERKS